MGARLNHKFGPHTADDILAFSAFQDWQTEYELQSDQISRHEIPSAVSCNAMCCSEADFYFRLGFSGSKGRIKDKLHQIAFSRGQLLRERLSKKRIPQHTHEGEV
jgi:hypothetical protein